MFCLFHDFGFVRFVWRRKKKCWREGSVGEECSGKVLERSERRHRKAENVTEKRRILERRWILREVLENRAVEKCWRTESQRSGGGHLGEKCWRSCVKKYWKGVGWISVGASEKIFLSSALGFVGCSGSVL